MILHNQWSTFIKSMLYKMYILGVLINELVCLFNHKWLILLHVNDLTRWTACINSMLYQIYIGCLYEWSRRSWQLYVCCPILHVPIYIENEWSYAVINFYQQYVILDVYAGCSHEWSRLSCQLYVCYPASRVPIHNENEWSYLLINVC